jgi:hypothetical protein
MLHKLKYKLNLNKIINNLKKQMMYDSVVDLINMSVVIPQSQQITLHKAKRSNHSATRLHSIQSDHLLFEPINDKSTTCWNASSIDAFDTSMLQVENKSLAINRIVVKLGNSADTSQ